MCFSKYTALVIWTKSFFRKRITNGHEKEQPVADFLVFRLIIELSKLVTNLLSMFLKMFLLVCTMFILQ